MRNRFNNSRVIGSKIYLYFLQCVSRTEDIYKIGFTCALFPRIRELQGHCPYLLNLSMYVEGDTYYITDLEAKLHREFNSNLIRGEWFYLPGKIIEEAANKFNLEIHAPHVDYINKTVYSFTVLRKKQ